MEAAREATYARLELVGNVTALGLFAGLALVDIRDVSDKDNGTLAVLGMTMVGAGAGYLLTEGRPYTQGQSHLVTLGFGLSVATGGLLARPLGFSDTRDEVMGTLLVASTIGVGASLALAHSMKPTRGEVFGSVLFGILGAGSFGLLRAAMEDDTPSGDGTLVGLALAMNAGAAAGLFVARKGNWSYPRVRRIGLAMMVGAGAGLGGGALIAGNKRDSRVTSLSALVGMWGGFAVGVAISANMDLPAATGSGVVFAPTLSNDATGLAAMGNF